MSNSGILVDCIVDPDTMNLPAADFEARIVEPMVARLRASAKRWDEPFVNVHLRMTAMPISQHTWDTLYAGG
jgi:hypothetical protein